MFSEISLVAWMSGAIVFAIGGGAGFYIARQIKDKHTLGLEKQLETTQNQLNEYQGEVNRHFLKTSLLFNKLTDDYREVYEHLATGAQKLCNDKSLATTLDLPEAKILAAALTTDARHADTTQPDAETIVATETTTTTTETTVPENTDQPKETLVEKQATAEQTHTESSAAESSTTETTPAAVEATPTITEEELKTLEANEQKKDTDEDIHLGAESTPSVKLEHHKTHSAIH